MSVPVHVRLVSICCTYMGLAGCSNVQQMQVQILNQVLVRILNQVLVTNH